MAELARLERALHLAIPPSIFMVLVYVCVSDKVFEMVRVMGDFVFPRTRNAARLLYVFANGTFSCLALAGIALQCQRPLAGEITIQDDTTCLPTMSLATTILLALLFADRLVLNALCAPGASVGFRARCCHGTSVVALLLALGDRSDDLVFPLLLACASNRSSAMRTPPWTVRGVCAATRAALLVTALHALATQAHGRRSAALLLLTLSGGGARADA
jgi:hypothetical protein